MVTGAKRVTAAPSHIHVILVPGEAPAMPLHSDWSLQRHTKVPLNLNFPGRNNFKPASIAINLNQPQQPPFSTISCYLSQLDLYLAAYVPTVTR